MHPSSSPPPCAGPPPLPVPDRLTDCLSSLPSACKEKKQEPLKSPVMVGGFSCNNEQGNASFLESTKRNQKHEKELAGREREKERSQMTSLFDMSDLHWWNNNYDISVQCIAIDVYAGRRDLVSVRSKSESVGPGLSVRNLSLPHPPRRARLA